MNNSKKFILSMLSYKEQVSGLYLFHVRSISLKLLQHPLLLHHHSNHHSCCKNCSKYGSLSRIPSVSEENQQKSSCLHRIPGVCVHSICLQFLWILSSKRQVCHNLFAYDLTDTPRHEDSSTELPHRYAKQSERYDLERRTNPLGYGKEINVRRLNMGKDEP